MANSAILIIPAFNEAESLGVLLEEVQTASLALDVLVVDDGSQDATAQVARKFGVEVLQLPQNVGVGAAVQVGFRYASENNYDYAVRIDGDGQHPPASVADVLQALKTRPELDAVMASRFLIPGGYTCTPLRLFGTRLLASILSRLCHQKITDPTSGFIGVNRAGIEFFSTGYPSDYPETQALGLLYRAGYRFMEIPVQFRKRSAGESSLRGWVSFLFVLNILQELLFFRFHAVKSRSRPPEP